VLTIRDGTCNTGIHRDTRFAGLTSERALLVPAQSDASRRFRDSRRRSRRAVHC